MAQAESDAIVARSAKFSSSPSLSSVRFSQIFQSPFAFVASARAFLTTTFMRSACATGFYQLDRGEETDVETFDVQRRVDVGYLSLKLDGFALDVQELCLSMDILALASGT